MSYISDLWAVIKGDGIALDETEAAVLGAPNGETVSIYAALASRHGALLGHLACAFLSVTVQWNHCANTLAGRPMSLLAYMRALLALGMCAALAIRGVGWLAAWLLHLVFHG